jgi:DNA repair protein RadD
MIPTLRPYQQAWIDGIRAAYGQGARKVLGVLPTGAGKTVAFTYLARSAASKGTRVCIVVHREELVRQTCAKLDYPHGVIAPKHLGKATNDLIQVASVQTLVRRLDRYEFDLLVIDEAHHAVAQTWLDVVNAYPKARVLGVTATPIRQDGKPLGHIFEGPLVIGPTVKELIGMGFLCPAEIYAPSTFNLSGVRTRGGDYRRDDLERAYEDQRAKITGCAVDQYRKHADGLPFIAFCISVKHAEDTAAAFRAAGYNVVSVQGNSAKEYRALAVNGLARGEFDGLTSCEIFGEGVDVPVVGCGILLRPTKSLSLALQQMGRCLRPHEGKDRAILLDHAGNTLMHGFPDDEREWSLEHGVVDKRKGEKAEAIRQCPQCFRVHRPAPECPECHYVYPVKERKVEVVDGDLVRLTSSEVLRLPDSQRQIHALRAKLTRIASERGIPYSWVERKVREKEFDLLRQYAVRSGKEVRAV